VTTQSQPSADDAPGPSILGGAVRRRSSGSLGTAVVRDLAGLVVERTILPGQLLPPEQQLAEHYAVSRTVIRESVKRLEEKGLLRAVQGRGTVVQDPIDWNVLDPIVLAVLIEHDSTVGILDDFSSMRAALEAMMARKMAANATPADVGDLRAALEHMRACLGDAEAFAQADADFHELVMARAGNFLAQNVTRALFAGARGSERFVRNQTSSAFEITLAEHTEVYEAIAAGDATRASIAMDTHITGSWARRRPHDYT